MTTCTALEALSLLSSTPAWHCTCYLTTTHSEESLHKMEDNKDLDMTSPPMIFTLKIFMVEQNLQSWFSNTSPPSPQVAHLLS